MKILAFEAETARADMMEAILHTDGHDLARFPYDTADFRPVVAAAAPDVVVVGTAKADDGLLARVADLGRDDPHPVVLLTEDGTPESINAAIDAGIHAYVVGDFAPERLKVILNVAIARFRGDQKLKTERDRALSDLSNRKIVDKAKGILMQQSGLSEDEAYAKLRKLAMDRKVTLAEIGTTIIEAHRLLS